MTFQKQKQVGDIVKFKAAAIVFGVAPKNYFLYNKRLNTWNDYIILKDQTGIILEVRSIENTIRPEHQYWYKESKERQERWIPYLWYCFKTAKIYLVFQWEME